MRVMPLHGASVAVAAIMTSAYITFVTLGAADKDANAPFQVASPPSQPPAPVDIRAGQTVFRGTRTAATVDNRTPRRRQY